MNNTHYNKTILIITGPTAAGKTDFALELASHIPSEIINIDMGQMYAPFSIGAAKPDWRSFSIPHHMFDIITTPRNYTVVEYRETFLRLLNDIWSRKKIPIVVGGSGFYLKSLFFPPDQHVAQHQNNHDLQQQWKNSTTEALWHQLSLIDPERAQKINKTDRYRIERALSLWQSTGKKPSECALSYMPPCLSYSIFYVTRDRQELYKRIDERVLMMMEQGWLEEVKNLLGTSWQLFIQNKKIIGYNELVQFLTSSDKSKNAYDAMIARIQQRSRNYAKRQDTFWRSLREALDNCRNNDEKATDSFIEDVNITHNNQSEYIKNRVSKIIDNT